MANNDDDDYMGDLSRFLQPHELLLSVDNHVQKRSFDTSELSKQQRKKLRLAQQQKEEDQNRSEGLGSAISSSNKGFKMMQQMGYKPGISLRKHGQGSLEPINVDVKRSPSGLGRDHVEKAQEQLKAKLAEFKHDMEKRKQVELKSEFQERRKASWKGRKIVRDYRKAQTALQHLEDVQSSVELGQSDKTAMLESTELKNASNENIEESVDNEDESEEEIELQESSICIVSYPWRK
ncbi:hypothetical protein GOP47_0000557 [Adiantum capillus-veneris]|uniref:G-patch domain-containing protein n=1 Tax=Adiantum capillus-veneris TaxID=13818 RepID=A0A9D4VDR4_ADICA|nr:hypothetical protein GOP47_0000557 [Adiantum capillus-veneris]